MKLEKQDLVVCKVDGVIFGARVLATGDPVQVVNLKNEHIQNLRSVLEIKKSDIYVNLGQDPLPGRAYGTDFSKVYRGRKEHPNFGTLNYFYKPKKEVSKNLLSGFNASYKILKKHKLEKIAEDDIIWEVEPYNKERYAGMYYAPKSDKVLPRIAFKPESAPSSMYPYIILHELAHHMHYTYIKRNTALEAKWIRLFNTSIKVQNIPKDTSLDLLDTLLNSDTVPSKLRSELDEELRLPYTWILRTIQQNHAVSVRELDVLASAQYHDELKSLWPRHTIKKKDLKPVISEYACKNLAECIAESISFYLTGRKIPKEATKLVERTLSYIKTQL